MLRFGASNIRGLTVVGMAGGRMARINGTVVRKQTCQRQQKNGDKGRWLLELFGIDIGKWLESDMKHMS